MRCENSQILWLLLVLPPALAVFFWWAQRARQKLLMQFIEARLLSQLTVGVSPARQKIRIVLLVLAVIFLIVALARPQYGFNLQEVEQRGLDIVVAVDTSKSMLTTDVAPDRLERAKLAALELMQDAKADRLGLVAFAGDAFLECPLTIDNTAFQQSVQALNVNSISQGGTALAAAINTALTAFKEKNHYKVLVLLTDGEDNDEGALAAAKAAAKAGLKIFTIGIGTAAGDLIRVTDANGNSDYVRDAQGNVVKSHLNEALLQQIAGAAGGFYLPLRGADTIETLYERGLAPLPKSEGRERLIRNYHEQFQWPLTAALLLLLTEMFLPERKSNRAKRSNLQPPTSNIQTLGMVTVMALLMGSHSAFASPAAALHDYNTGDYTNAFRQFKQLAEVNTNDLRLVFNMGTAAYRATNYDEALNDFKQAATAPDLKLQQEALYNLGNTQYRLGELKFEPSMEGLNDMEDAWKQAAQTYAHAVELDKNDADAAANLAFVKQQVTQIDRLREVMRRAKLEADEAVRRNEFHQAFEIMEGLTKNKIAAKRFEDYTKKLKQIDDIATPHQP
jgi:Ca-activated chloride channel family protein